MSQYRNGFDAMGRRAPAPQQGAPYYGEPHGGMGGGYPNAPSNHDPRALQVDNRPSGNAFRDAWIAERTEAQQQRLQALAENAGARLYPETVLRPFVYTLSVENLVGGQQNVQLPFVPQFFAYVRRVTATVRGLTFGQNAEPAAYQIPWTSPLHYIEGTITRTLSEQVFSDFIPLSEWVGDGREQYVFDIIPFVAANDTMNVTLRVAGSNTIGATDEIVSISKVDITFHMMRFPQEMGPR